MQQRDASQRSTGPRSARQRAKPHSFPFPTRRPPPCSPITHAANEYRLLCALPSFDAVHSRPCRRPGVARASEQRDASQLDAHLARGERGSQASIRRPRKSSSAALLVLSTHPPFMMQAANEYRLPCMAPLVAPLIRPTNGAAASALPRPSRNHAPPCPMTHAANQYRPSCASLGLALSSSHSTNSKW
jgi:hypothetical protein